MKKFFGMASLVVLTSVSSVSMAKAQLALDTVVVQQSARAVQAAEIILNQNIANASQLVGRDVAGVAVTAAESASLFALAAPLAQALKAKGMTPTRGQFDQMAAAVSSEKSGVQSNAAINALVESLNEHGNLDAATIRAEIDEARGENVANLLPSEVAQMSESEIALGYQAVTEQGAEALNAKAQTPEEQATREAAIKLALTSSLENCSTTAANCLRLGQEAVEAAIVNGVTRHGRPALSFLDQALRGEFEGDENSPTLASSEQFMSGYAVSAYKVGPVLANEQARKSAPASTRSLASCMVGGGPNGEYAGN